MIEIVRYFNINTYLVFRVPLVNTLQNTYFTRSIEYSSTLYILAIQQFLCCKAEEFVFKKLNLKSITGKNDTKTT